MKLYCKELVRKVFTFYNMQKKDYADTGGARKELLPICGDTAYRIHFGKQSELTANNKSKQKATAPIIKNKFARLSMICSVFSLCVCVFDE